MRIYETFSIEDAFKALNEKAPVLTPSKTSYRGFEDLFDQVYCSLTHGEDRGEPRKILGDLGRVETKYADYDVSVECSTPGVTQIAVVAPDNAINNAISVAEIYGLDYNVKPFSRGISKVFISIPDNEPVDKSLLHYVDSEGRLEDISHIYSDANGNTVGSYSRRGQLITASADSDLEKDTISEDNSKKVCIICDFYKFGYDYYRIRTFGDTVENALLKLLRTENFGISTNQIAEFEKSNASANEIINAIKEVKGSTNIITSLSDDKGQIFIQSNYRPYREELEESTLTEDVASSMPVTPLSSSDIHSFVESIPEATSTRPPQPFKLGYIREMRAEIPAKYKGGRGSEDQPFVRIFKATEYSRLYTKAPYENLGSTKAYRKETGKEAGYERSGFHHNDAEAGNILNAIGSYPNGDLALQAYPMRDNKIKVAYFISIDDSDLVPTTKEDIAQYLTPAASAKLLGTRDSETPKSADNINRFKLSGIYMIGNLGHSII